MLTRQRTITQQFTQQKSLRSTAAKAKVVQDVEVTPAVTATPSASNAKRLRSSARVAELPSQPTAKKTAAPKRKVETTPIEAAFRKASAKTKKADRALEPLKVQTKKNEETVPEQDVEKTAQTPKYLKVDDVIRRRTLLQDKDNTPTQEVVKRNSPAVASPSIAHKTVLFNEKLKLPVTYDLLLNQFIAADRCVAMMDNRSETVTFNKLKTAVETATKRTFTEENLGQILLVFPGCYKLGYDKTCYNSTAVELVIRADPMAGVDKEDIQLSPQCHLTVSIMRMRENTFKQGLLQLVFDSHLSYLKALSPGVAVKLDPGKLRRWHPNFPLETATPVITAAKMPERPGGATPRHWSAKDILERYAKNTPHLAKFLDKQEKPAPTTDTSRVAPMDPPQTPKSFKILKSGPFAGLREDLVEKIRQREQREKELKGFVDPVADLNRIRRGRLPQLIRIIRGLFFRGTKTIAMKDVLSTVKYSWSSPISEDEVRATFDLLIELCPKWIRILKLSISPDPLVQVDADVNIADLVAQLPK